MPVKQMLEALSARLARFSLWFAAIAAIMMISSLLLGVFFRYVVQSALSWSGEVALLTFTWTVFLMASVGLREGFHARIALVDQLLPASGKRVLHCLLLVMIGIFMVYLFVIGWQFVVFNGQLKSPATGFPMWLRNAAIPTMAVLGVIHVLARLFGQQSLDEPEQS